MKNFWKAQEPSSDLQKEAGDTGTEIGRSMADGIADGMKEKNGDLRKRMRSVLTDVVSAGKKALGIHSPSKVLNDEVGKQIVAGVAQGIDENGSLAKRALEKLNGGMLDTEKAYLQEKERLNNENFLMEEAKYQREYQKRLASARNAVNAENIKQNEILRRKKAADEQYLAQLKASAEAEKAVLAQLEKDIRSIYQDIAEEANENLSRVFAAQEKLENKLSGYGDLTRKVIFHGLGEDGTDLVFTELADMDGQIQEMEEYAQSLEMIKERMRTGGFSEDSVQNFFSEIAQLSFEKGKEFSGILLAAKDEDFSSFVQQWIKKQQLSEQASKALYQDQFFDAVDETKKYMVEKLEEAGLEIPDGFFLSGSISAENFGTAFLEEMQEQMQRIRTMVESYAASLSPILTLETSAAQNPQVYHNTTTYVLNSSGETVAQQLMSARSHSELERMRNE